MGSTPSAPCPPSSLHRLTISRLLALFFSVSSTERARHTGRRTPQAAALTLSSYDLATIFAEELPLECRLSEKDLETWARHNASKPVGSIPYSYLDIDVNPASSAEEQEQIRKINERFQSVFDASRGALPTLADHPSVTRNFNSNLVGSTSPSRSLDGAPVLQRS